MVECNLPKVEVASSNLVSRSIKYKGQVKYLALMFLRLYDNYSRTSVCRELIDAYTAAAERANVGLVLAIYENIVRAYQVASLEAAESEFLEQSKVGVFKNHDYAAQFVRNEDIAVAIQGYAGDDAESSYSAAPLAEYPRFPFRGQQIYPGRGWDGKEKPTVPVNCKSTQPTLFAFLVAHAKFFCQIDTFDESALLIGNHNLHGRKTYLI